jgi:hypothetical protein
MLIKLNTSSFVEGIYSSLAGPPTASLYNFCLPGSEINVAENTTHATSSISVVWPSGSMTIGSLALSSVSAAKGLPYTCSFLLRLLSFLI